jgi:hypothetical protein
MSGRWRGSCFRILYLLDDRVFTRLVDEMGIGVGRVLRCVRRDIVCDERERGEGGEEGGVSEVWERRHYWLRSELRIVA